MEELLNVEDVARLLGIKISTVYKYAMAGRLPVTKINGCLRFRPSELQKFIEENSRPSLRPVA